MYQPANFREDRLEVQHALIRRNPVGLLITHGTSGLLANPIPFMLHAEASPLGTLRAHLARANAQWREIDPELDALVVFHGEDAYVSPSYYESKREHGRVVPTWNYTMVQARGTMRVHDDADWLRAQVEALTAHQEGSREKPWAVDDAPGPFIEGQLRGIVGLEMEITHIEGKWKASQNRPPQDRAGVAAGLEAGAPEEAGMANLVRSLG